MSVYRTIGPTLVVINIDQIIALKILGVSFQYVPYGVILHVGSPQQNRL